MARRPDQPRTFSSNPPDARIRKRSVYTVATRVRKRSGLSHGFGDVLHHVRGMLLVQKEAMPGIELEDADGRVGNSIGGLAVAVRHQRAPHLDVHSGYEQVMLRVHELA